MFVNRAAAALLQVLHAHGLHRILGLEGPAQVVAGHEMTQPGVERHHVVVLEVHLDEGFPVVVALVQLHMPKHHALEVELADLLEASQVGADVAPVVLEQQAVPLAQRVALQVQAGVVRKVRCAQQLAKALPRLGRAAAVVGPAVQRADDVAAGVATATLLQVAAALEHHGLPVAADVAHQFHALRGAHQSPALAFVR